MASEYRITWQDAKKDADQKLKKFGLALKDIDQALEKKDFGPNLDEIGKLLDEVNEETSTKDISEKVIDDLKKRLGPLTKKIQKIYGDYVDAVEKGKAKFGKDKEYEKNSADLVKIMVCLLSDLMNNVYNPLFRDLEKADKALKKAGMKAK